MLNLIRNCNKYSGQEDDMFFDEATLMCVPSRNADKWVYRYEESLTGQLLVIAFLMLVFHLLLPRVRSVFEKTFERQKNFSSEQMKKIGYFGPLKTELKYDAGSAFHHILAGTLMFAGWYLNGQTMLFRLGVLTEVSIELLDIAGMILSRGLWATVPKERGFEPYMVMLAHHLPGIGLILPLNLWCSCVDIWQRIAFAMELVGGQLLVNGVVRKLVVDSPMNCLMTDVFSFTCWVWARFYVATPLMIKLCRMGLEYECKATYALIVGGLVMTLFNLMISIDFLMKVHGDIVELQGRQRASQQLKKI